MAYGNSKIVWVAWENHRRTIELSKYIGITPKIYQSNICRIIKYPIFTIKTLTYIASNNPKIVIIQNPSIILTLVACFIKLLLPYKLVVDAHNAAILPEKYVIITKILNKIIYKMTDLIVVTNENLAKIVAHDNGKSFVLPDRLPLFDLSSSNQNYTDQFIIVCICTYSEDEPYREMLLAATELSEGKVKFVFTGDFRRLDAALLAAVNESVCFSGYLPENDYISLLGSANLIMDLTKRENCLVCGAYEAVACGVPLVLSDHEALKNYFHKGVVYTENSIDSIKLAILYGRAHYPKLKRQILELQDEIRLNWEDIGHKLLTKLNEI